MGLIIARASSRSDICGAGSMSLLRRRVPSTSFIAFVCCTTAGASCRSRIFCFFASRFISVSSTSRRLCPSSSASVTGLNSFWAAAAANAASSPLVSKNPAGAFFSKGISAL